MGAAGGVNNLNFGLLILRLGVGIMMLCHGWPKLISGSQTWNGLGQAMGVFGITLAPVFWGFMASVAEAVGGVCMAAGILFRPFCAMLVISMTVAAAMHIHKGDAFGVYSHALVLVFVFIGLLITGAGSIALGRLVPGIRDTWAQ